MQDTTLILPAVALLWMLDAVPAQSFARVSAPGPGFAPVGDVDGDGRLDYCVGSFPNLAILSGATGAVLSQLVISWASPNVFPVRALFCDVNADGCDDLVQVSAGGDSILSGATGAVLYTAPNATIRGFGDFDGDGWDDFVENRIDTASQTVFQTAIVSGRTFTDIQRLTASQRGIDSVGYSPVGDVDGDGEEDVLVQYDQPALSTFRATIARGRAMVPSFSASFLSAVGDTNGDGRDDVIDGLVIRDGATWAALWTLPGNPSLTGGKPDLDGDGCKDIWVLLGSGAAATAFSGRTHAAMAGSLTNYLPGYAGDIDGMGRDAAYDSGQLLKWQDPVFPYASRATRRGMPGTTSQGNRPRIKTRGHCGIGHSLFLDLRGALPNGIAILVWGSPVDQDLAAIGATGNHAYVSGAGSLFLPASPHGVAQHHIDVPNSTSLLSASASVQFALFDPAANALGLVTSDAIDIRVDN
jgi:hypothetical protein